jgi:hypothetical protein
MHLAGFEPTIPTSERPQTHTLGRAATGIGLLYSLPFRKICPPQPRGVVLAASNTVRVVTVLTRFHISARTRTTLTDICGIFSAPEYKSGIVHR